MIPFGIPAAHDYFWYPERWLRIPNRNTLPVLTTGPKTETEVVSDHIHTF
jgi:hypothetical protein